VSHGVVKQRGQDLARPLRVTACWRFARELHLESDALLGRPREEPVGGLGREDREVERLVFHVEDRFGDARPREQSYYPEHVLSHLAQHAG
jgi:hypothetical protein